MGNCGVYDVRLAKAKCDDILMVVSVNIMAESGEGGGETKGKPLTTLNVGL